MHIVCTYLYLNIQRYGLFKDMVLYEVRQKVTHRIMLLKDINTHPVVALPTAIILEYRLIVCVTIFAKARNKNYNF